MRRSRNTFSFPDFSLRRLILQGARAARGSPPLGQRYCDVEKNISNNNSGGGGGTSSTSATPTTAVTTKNEKYGSNNYVTSSCSATNSTGTCNKSNTDTSSQNSITGVSPAISLTINVKNSSSSLKRTSTTNVSIKNSQTTQECPLCIHSKLPEDFYSLFICKHIACRGCLESYLIIEITESRTDIACPQCAESMHPSDIHTLLLNYPSVMNKYEDFMVRRVLLADPDSRWCPAPDCSYAVIATGCASCPRLKCERPGCDVNFCYHCKAEWHPDQTCDAARASRQSPTRAPSGSISQDSQHRDDIKPCPRCQVLIVKMDDGSCNHMVCAICGSEFCWLCMKEISDLHYLSPSGCTFWGKKPWSRKKKLLWQLGTLVGAPVGIALVAGIAVPAMMIGIPIWVGRKIHTRYKTAGKHKRHCALLGGVAASVIVSPVLAGLAVAIGVPILLFYVYGVVPVSLCRAGCGVSTSKDGVKFEFDEEEDGSRNQDAASVDAVSRIGATSIGEVSLSVASGSHLGVSGQNQNFSNILNNTQNRESTTALAGSITGHRLEVQADVSSSETASAVTCVSEKSGNTLNDTASTRALAGSILSYKQHVDSSNISEDGTSERVRFDNTVCFVIDGKKECSDIWYTAPLDQDHGADKASLSSGRSFRSSERSFRDDLDTTSLSSGPKRMVMNQRIPKLNTQHRNLSLDSNSGSNNIPEIDLEEQEHPDMMQISKPPSQQFINLNCDINESTGKRLYQKSHTNNKSIDIINKSLQSSPIRLAAKPIIINSSTSSSSSNKESNLTNLQENLSTEKHCSSNNNINITNNNNYNKSTTNNDNKTSNIDNNKPSKSSSTTSNDSKNISKTAKLRNLFFFQNEDGGT